jgi:hypothetical protein
MSSVPVYLPEATFVSFALSVAEHIFFTTKDTKITRG